MRNARHSFGGLARSINLRSQSMPPAASNFAHWAGVNRMDRCSSFSLGGVGGLPRPRFSCSIASLCVMQKMLAKRHLLNHNKCTNSPEQIMRMPSANGPKPDDLPKILAVLGVQDFGPSDFGQSAATCPHCGAHGRYVWSFLCDDGTKRGAMSGCFNLFRGSDSRTSKLVQEAFNRKSRYDSTSGAVFGARKLASWWTDIVREAEEFGRTGSVETYPEFASRVAAIEERRQTWLRGNGYGRKGWRR